MNSTNLPNYDTLSAEAIKKKASAYYNDPYSNFPDLQVNKILNQISSIATNSGAGQAVLALSTLGHLYPRYVADSLKYDYKEVIKVLQEYGYTLTELPTTSKEPSLNEAPLLEDTDLDLKGTFPKEVKYKFYRVVWCSSLPIFHEEATRDCNVIQFSLS